MATNSPITVFHGRVSQNSAQVYAQVTSRPGGGEWTLSGTVRGPRCQFSHTLPTSFSFRDAGRGSTLLAEAIVSEPCFWSPRLPSLYDVRIELCCGGDVQQTFERSLGIRFWGTRGNSLVLEGDRWVLRGVQSANVQEAPIADWRAASAAVVVTDPSNEQCRMASEQGLLIVARLVSTNGIRQQLQRLGRWGAVAVAVLPAETDLPADVRQVAPNLLLAQWEAGQQPVKPVSWAQLVFCEVTNARRFHELVQGCPLPLVAVRGLNGVQSLIAARRGCDQLQRDLAPHGDYAGYVV